MRIVVAVATLVSKTDADLMWLWAPSFVQNLIAELTRSSLGPWLVFAAHTGLDAAALVFIFVLLVTLLFSLLLMCAGNPKRMLAIVLFLGPVAAFYSALHVGAVVGLFGWPVLWALERVFGMSADAASWASGILSINYASVGLVSIAAVALVILALGQGIWKRQHALQAMRAKGRLDWPLSSPRQRVDEHGLTREASHARSGYHRIGVIAGPLFAASVLLVGAVLAREQRSVLPLLCFGLSAAVVFAITYGIGQLLGSLVDIFISKMHSADHVG